MLIIYILSAAASRPQEQHWVAATDSMWPTKPKSFTIWPSAGKVWGFPFYMLKKIFIEHLLCIGLLWWNSGKESACQCRKQERLLIPASEGCPGGGNGNPLQYSCLGNPLDRGTWRATVHGVTKELNMTESLNNNNPETDAGQIRTIDAPYLHKRGTSRNWRSLWLSPIPGPIPFSQDTAAVPESEVLDRVALWALWCWDGNLGPPSREPGPPKHTIWFAVSREPHWRPPQVEDLWSIWCFPNLAVPRAI